MSARRRRIVLDDGSEVWARSTDLPGRYIISRTKAEGQHLGAAWKTGAGEWAAHDRYGVAHWIELTGRDHPTLRAATEALVRAMET